MDGINFRLQNLQEDIESADSLCVYVKRGVLPSAALLLNRAIIAIHIHIWT